jgi:hypothetical protein
VANLPSSVSISDKGYYQQEGTGRDGQPGFVWVNADKLPDSAPSDLKVWIDLPGYGRVVAFLKWNDRFGKFSGGLKQDRPRQATPTTEVPF